MLKRILKKNKLMKRIYTKLMQFIYMKIRKKNFINNGESVFCEFMKICEQHYVKIWLCYGTLLGYIRNAGIIKHDDDFDLGLWYEDYSKELEHDLVSNGFKLEHQFKGNDGYKAFEQTFVKKGVCIDLFYHYKDETKIWTHVFHREPDSDLPENIWMVRKLPFSKGELKIVDFLNTKVYIPENSEQYLAETYGESWRIPDKHFDWRKGPLKDSILPGVFGTMETY